MTQPASLPGWTGWLRRLAWSLFCGAVLAAQVPAFRRFDGRDGLPQSQVRVFLEDRRGFLWVGTEAGVARMGASGFHVYDLSRGLGAGRVRALLEDDRGAIWVAQSGAALARIQGSRVESMGPAEGLPDNNSYALCLDHEGRVLVGTAKGLYRFEGQAFRQVPLGSWDPLPVLSLVRDEQERIWMSSTKGRVGLWDGRGVQECPLPKPAAEDSVLKLQLGGDGRLWAMTRGGLWIRDVDGAWAPFPLGGLPLRPRLQDFNLARDGGLIVALGSDGLWMKAPGASARWWSVRDGLPEEQINVGFRDSRGVLWVGTNGEGMVAQALEGLASLKGQGPWQLGPVLSMEGLAGEGLFLGTGRGLYLWQEGRGLVRRWTAKEGLPGPEIWGICPDGRGGLWLGSNKGMARWNAGRLSPNPAYDGARILQILPFGEGYLVASERGLSEMDGEGRITSTRDVLAEVGLLPDTLVLAPDGRDVLVGTSQGVWRYDGTRLHRAFADAPFAKAEVVSLYRDPKLGLWVGTVQGLYVLREGRWTTYSTQEGLPDGYIYFIGPAGRGLVAVGHGRGVTLMDGHSRMVHLNQSLGLLANETNQGAVYLDPKGRLWCGLIGGAGILEGHAKLAPPQLPAPTVLEATCPTGTAALPTSLDLSAHPEFLELEFESGMPITPSPPLYEVMLEGTSNQWQRVGESHRMRYARLAGGDYVFRTRASLDGRAWVEGAPLAIHVRRTWMEHPAGRIGLLLAGALAMLALVRWRTWRLQRAARELEASVEERTRDLDLRNHELQLAHSELEEALESKVAFTRMVVHDLRSPLTTISLIVEQMAEAADARSEARPRQLTVLEREAGRLESLLHRLLDQARSESVEQSLHLTPSSPIAILAGMEELLRLKAEGASLSCAYDEDPGLDDAQVLADPLAVQQILLNLIGNALKYTPPGGQVGVRSTLLPGYWVLSVWDTGRGMDTSDTTRLFRPFTQVEIADIGKGWGLGLSIVKSLADAHGARIEVESKPGRGSLFRVIFPLFDTNSRS